MEHVVSRNPIRIAAAIIALLGATPIAAQAQATPPTASEANPPSKMWLVLGGTSTTLRGDCQEDCVAHGTGDYLHAGSVLVIAGTRVNRQMDVGAEVSWVPATTADGTPVRTTFLLADRPVQAVGHTGLLRKRQRRHGLRSQFRLRRDRAPCRRSRRRRLGLSYGAGWAFRRADRVGFQVFGAQHAAALGDFQTAGGVIATDVIGNFWSIGAAIVIR